MSYTEKILFDFQIFFFLFFHRLSFLGWIFDFSFLSSICLGAPLGLFLIRKFFYFSILISDICGMSFVGVIFDFSFLFSVFYLVGGSPRPVSYTEKIFCYFSVFISHFCGMSFLGGIFDFSFLFSVFSLVGGSPRPVSYTEKSFVTFQF